MESFSYFSIRFRLITRLHISLSPSESSHLTSTWLLSWWTISAAVSPYFSLWGRKGREFDRFGRRWLIILSIMFWLHVVIEGLRGRDCCCDCCCDCCLYGCGFYSFLDFICPSLHIFPNPMALFIIAVWEISCNICRLTAATLCLRLGS